MDITQEQFDAFLAWLDPDRDVAGQKFEIIRSGLIKIAISRGFSDAEEVADDTVWRVIKKLPDFVEGYVGEPTCYFRGVLRNVMHEHRRQREITVEKFPEEITAETEKSDRHECLIKCLELLPKKKRELVLDYGMFKGSEKITQHKLMADELCITVGALRTRAHHIRTKVEKCVDDCLRKLFVKQNMSLSS